MTSPGLAGIALSALAGVLVGVLVQFWKSLRDERRILCDEFAKSALEAADVASGYWKGGPASSEIEASKLIALQRRLDGYRVLLDSTFTPAGSREVQTKCMNLFDALTGGDFRSANKAADERRASSVHIEASDLVISIRRAFIESARGSSIAQNLILTRPMSVVGGVIGWGKGSFLRARSQLNGWQKKR